jgi:ABC-type glutathione transport system ATPase component
MNPVDLLLALSQIQIRSTADNSFILEVDNFVIKRGERVGVFGDSGSGKTTMLRVLSGAVFFDTSYEAFGKCMFYPKDADPVDLHNLKSVHARQQKKIPIAFVPQEPMASFSLVHKIGQQLDNIASILSKDDALKMVGLDPELKNRYPRELSLGQMQRVAIAAALCMGAELILMDEPTASLDIIQKQNLLEILNQLNQNQGASFVIVSHQSDFIRAFCTVGFKMENGFLLREDEVLKKSVSATQNVFEDSNVPNETSILKMQDISFRYPGQYKNVLDKFSFEFQRGTTYGITGVSGCGKSTLGRLICGLDNPDKGIIEYSGKKAEDHSVKEWIGRKRSIQYLWQDALMAMNPAYTAGKILEFAFNDQKSWIKDLSREYMERLLDHCGIDDAMLNLYPVQLSGGQRQRINLAKALLGKPDILVADEPFSSIDEAHKPALYQLFNSIPEMKDVTLLLISHDPADLIACCENVLIMDSGKVVESGNLKKIIKNPAHPVTRQLLNASYVV